MKNIPYKFVDGTTSNVEVSDEFYTIFKKILDEEAESNCIACQIVPLSRLKNIKVEINGKIKRNKKEYHNIQNENLQKAIDNLTVSQKILITEIFFNGKTQKEVAEMQGLKPIAIKNRLERIFSKLEKSLSQTNF